MVYTYSEEVVSISAMRVIEYAGTEGVAYRGSTEVFLAECSRYSPHLCVADKHLKQTIS